MDEKVVDAMPRNENSNMDISVIVPLYKGQKYVSSVIEMIRNNQIAAEKLSMELIFVNDFPEDKDKIEIANAMQDGLKIKVVSNSRNSGIHASRLHGLTESSGEYILFLDQDDVIANDALLKMYGSIGDADAIVANSYSEDSVGCKHIKYESEYDFNNVNRLRSFFYFGNMISSPGQCLIKRSAVSTVWKTHIMNQNGADDWLLWILFLREGHVFKLLDECLYTHKYTGENLSLNYDKMKLSCEQAYDIYVNTGSIAPDMKWAFRSWLAEMPCWVGRDRQNRMMKYVRHPNVMIYKLMYEIGRVAAGARHKYLHGRCHTEKQCAGG